MSEKLIISWEEYTNTVERLAVQIDNSGYKPTILIGRTNKKAIKHFQ